TPPAGFGTFAPSRCPERGCRGFTGPVPSASLDAAAREANRLPHTIRGASARAKLQPAERAIVTSGTNVNLVPGTEMTFVRIRTRVTGRCAAPTPPRRPAPT